MIYFPTTRTVTPPTWEPLSLPEAKQWAKIDIDEDNALVSQLIKDARSHTETITNRALPRQTRETYPPRFPCGDLLVPYPPLHEVTAFEWTDTAGNVNSWTVSNGNLLSGSTVMAHVDAVREPAAIRLAYGQSWPTATLKTSNPIRIAFTCGWDEAADVPSELRRAMALLIAHWYENRSAVVVGQITAIKSERVQLAFDALVENFRAHYA